MSVRVEIAVHLASGKTVDTSIDVPDDLEDDEVQALIHDRLTENPRGAWTSIGDLNVHSAAIQAVELL